MKNSVEKKQLDMESSSLRICVPLLSNDVQNGPESELLLAAHFGLAKRFAVVDSSSGEILDECDIAGYCRGPCQCPLPSLANHQIDALAGHSIGFRVMQLSRRAKLPVLSVDAQTLGELRQELQGQSPAPLLMTSKCLTTLCQ